MDLPITKRNQTPQYDAPKGGFTGLAVNSKDDNLVSYMPNFSHKSVSMIGLLLKQYLRSKFADDKCESARGSFEVTILEEKEHSMELLRFLVVNSIKEELHSVGARECQKLTGRKISLVCYYGIAKTGLVRDLRRGITRTNISLL